MNRITLDLSSLSAESPNVVNCYFPCVIHRPSVNPCESVSLQKQFYSIVVGREKQNLLENCEIRGTGRSARLRREELVDSVMPDATIYNLGGPQLEAFHYASNNAGEQGNDEELRC